MTFAGAIGGQRFVTVLHADGLRTSYAFLATIEVHAGQVVAQGDVVGTSGATVHFGVRRGTVYLDPELLLAGWRPRWPGSCRSTDGAGRPPAAVAPRRGHDAWAARRGAAPIRLRWLARPASGGPPHHERPATCGRPPGRGRVRHQNRRKET